MPELVLIRGLPGSGKSTYAANQFKYHVHKEADMYFMRGGKYKFDFTKLNAAHTWCQDEVRKYLRSGDNVVVTNTLTQSWEFDAYLSLIAEIGMEGIDVSLRVVEMKTQYQNIHGVPEDKMDKMRQRWHSWESVCEDCGLNDENCTYEVVE